MFVNIFSSVGESPFVELADVCAQLAPESEGDEDVLADLVSSIEVGAGGPRGGIRTSKSDSLLQ